MARIRRGILFQNLTAPAVMGRTDLTRFRVRGENSTKLRTVTVDGENLWACSCPVNRYQGLCYHVNAIQFELDLPIIINRLLEHRIEPAAVNAIDFDRYFALPRFVAEPIYKGLRQYVTLARWVHLDKQKKKDWCFPGSLKWAGTIIEGAWDSYGFKKAKFRVFDCLYYKGLDHRFSPLAIRRELAEAVVKAMNNPLIIMSDYEYSPEGKKRMMESLGCCMLKDVNSPYDTTSKTPRCWMIRIRGDYGQNRET